MTTTKIDRMLWFGWGEEWLKINSSSLVTHNLVQDTSKWIY